MKKVFISEGSDCKPSNQRCDPRILLLDFTVSQFLMEVSLTRYISSLGELFKLFSDYP